MSNFDLILKNGTVFFKTKREVTDIGVKDGKIVEFGPSEAIYRNPQEEYTRRLIDATPCDDLENIRRLVAHRRTLRGK